jgi:hypothetical protein
MSKSISLGFEEYPSARYGHVLIPYYDYLILFGGITTDQSFSNDLWIYKIS